MFRWSVAPLASLLLVGCAAGVALGAVPSPAPLASPGPSGAPSPSATPFPWPTLPPEQAVAPFRPSGPPDAVTSQHGVTVRLWLSSRVVAPGSSVQAVVRITNIGDDAAWHSDHPCMRYPPLVSDLTAVIAPGDLQVGNADAFKRLLTKDAGLRVAYWDPVDDRPIDRGSGMVVAALADCGPIGVSLKRLPSGRTLEQRWSWYPADPLDGSGAWLRPLPPGPVPVTFSWYHEGRGTQAQVAARLRPLPPITVTADVELTGSGSGSPSMLELADQALMDPDFRAWVEADPTRGDWAGAWITAWPATDVGADAAQPALPDLRTRAPEGAIEFTLARDRPGHAGATVSAWVDAWTGELLGSTTR